MYLHTIYIYIYTDGKLYKYTHFDLFVASCSEEKGLALKIETAERGYIGKQHGMRLHSNTWS